MVVVFVSAGCGSTSKTQTTAATGSTLPPGAKPAIPNKPPPPKSTSYNVVLAGFPGGAPSGSGLATVSINAATDELCWKFLDVKNIPKPTVARLYRTFPGASGEGGFLLGSTYKPSGCVHLSAISLGVIERRPDEMYLDIHTAHPPWGVIEGPLEPGGEPGGAATNTPGAQATPTPGATATP
jgi:hypothetical protein